MINLYQAKDCLEAEIDETYCEVIQRSIKIAYANIDDLDVDTDGHWIFIEEDDDQVEIFLDNTTEEEWMSYEDIIYYEDVELWEILILCNNEFGLVYFIPNKYINPRLLKHMQ